MVSGSLCHEAVMVIDVAVRMGIKGALRSTVTGKAETRRLSRWLFAGDVGKRSSRTFKAFSAVLDTCPVPTRSSRRSSILGQRRWTAAAKRKPHTTNHTPQHTTNHTPQTTHHKPHTTTSLPCQRQPGVPEHFGH
jgi:hypothetical protein